MGSSDLLERPRRLSGKVASRAESSKPAPFSPCGSVQLPPRRQPGFQCPRVLSGRRCRRFKSDGEDRVRYLLGMIERVLGAGLKPGIGRFECLLKPLGIAPADDNEIRRDLYELAAIRNAIVHRAKLADSRLLSLCPWLRYKDGDALNVFSDQSRPRD